MRPQLHLVLAALVLAVVTELCASNLRSQTSPWATLAVPGGVIPTQASSQGKLCVYRDGNTLHVHSAVTRRWHATASAATSVLRLNNDCLLALDGGTWTAFSAYRGTFAPLAVSGAAQLLNPLGNVNDSLLLVVDAGQLHWFSAFVGTWGSRPISPNWQVSVQRHVAVLGQGTLLSGLEAFGGTWTDHVVGSVPNVVSADGTAGFAFGAGRVHAFSATHRQWSDAVQPVNTTFVRADDWGVWFTGSEVLAFSAPRARFAHVASGASFVASSQDLFALLDGPSGLFAFSAFTGSFSAPIAPSSASVNANTAVALCIDATGAHAYSAVLGTVARRTNVGNARGAANVVAWVADASGAPAFYSALLGRWFDAPLSAVPGDPTLTATSAAALTTTGAIVFSPRSGRFVPLADPTVALYGTGASAPLLAVGATTLHAFDARAERWVATPRATTGAVTPMGWRTAAVVIDGSTAFGFGSAAGTWTQHALSGPLVSWRANSESVRLCTANEVVAWSAVGEALWLAQFPEFRRVQPIGVPMRIVVAVPANGLALLGLGVLAPAPLQVPGLGELLLAPASIGGSVLPGTPGGEPVVVELPALSAPTLLGREFAAQAALWPSGAPPYLTDLATVMPL